VLAESILKCNRFIIIQINIVVNFERGASAYDQMQHPKSPVKITSVNEFAAPAVFNPTALKMFDIMAKKQGIKINRFIHGNDPVPDLGAGLFGLGENIGKTIMSFFDKRNTLHVETLAQKPNTLERFLNSTRAVLEGAFNPVQSHNTRFYRTVTKALMDINPHLAPQPLQYLATQQYSMAS
jgi:hypothetical protein